MSALHLIWIVARKEIVDNLRDRRSVGNALFTVLLNPLLFILLFGILGRTFSEKAEQALVLPLQGAGNAPSLIGFLEQNNVEIEDAPAAAEVAVRAGLLALPQLQSMIGLRVALSGETIVVALLLVLPVVFMAVALELFIASFAKSFKEAQTYVTYLSLAGFMPAVFLSVLPIQTQSWMMLIPSISQTMLLRNLTRGEGLAPGLVAMATVLTLAVGVAALVATIRLYNRERIVLGSAI